MKKNVLITQVVIIGAVSLFISGIFSFLDLQSCMNNNCYPIDYLLGWLQLWIISYVVLSIISFIFVKSFKKISEDRMLPAFFVVTFAYQTLFLEIFLGPFYGLLSSSIVETIILLACQKKKLINYYLLIIALSGIGLFVWQFSNALPV